MSAFMAQMDQWPDVAFIAVLALMFAVGVWLDCRQRQQQLPNRRAWERERRGFRIVSHEQSESMHRLMKGGRDAA